MGSVLLEVMRCMLLCTLEAVESELCLLEVLEVLKVPALSETKRCAGLLAGGAEGAGNDALYAALVLEATEGLYLLEVLDVLEMPEVMRCVQYAGGSGRFRDFKNFPQ